MSASLPALPSTPSDQFYESMEITNPPTMQVESVRREEFGADAFKTTKRICTHYLEKGISGIKHQKKMFSIIGTQRTRSHGRWNTRQFQIAVRENKRQARGAVRQAMQES